MTLVDHLKKYLGHITEGWSPLERASSLRVVRFGGQPTDGVSTYASLGLSDHRLRTPQGREIRQELVFAAHDEYSPDEVASFVMTFAEHLLRTHRGLARGEVIGPSHPLIPGVAADAVYAATPVAYPDDLHIYTGADVQVVLIWLIPLMHAEAELVKRHGWQVLEGLLEERQPDLFDLQRADVVSSELR